jgi:hypothetical protein
MRFETVYFANLKINNQQHEKERIEKSKKRIVF